MMTKKKLDYIDKRITDLEVEQKKLYDILSRTLDNTKVIQDQVTRLANELTRLRQPSADSFMDVT